jgi:hypothetical protein
MREAAGWAWREDHFEDVRGYEVRIKADVKELMSVHVFIINGNTHVYIMALEESLTQRSACFKNEEKRHRKKNTSCKQGKSHSTFTRHGFMLLNTLRNTGCKLPNANRHRSLLDYRFRSLSRSKTKRNQDKNRQKFTGLFYIKLCTE